MIHFRFYYPNEFLLNEIDRINSLINQSMLENSIMAETFVNKALHIADSLHYELGKAAALINMVENLKKEGDYPEALKLTLQSLKIFERKNDFKGIVICHENLGYIYGCVNKEDMSLEHINIALNIAKKHSKVEVGNCLNSLGFIYKSMHKTKQALDYLSEALLYQKEINNDIGIAKAMTNIGIIYKEQNNTRDALKYLKEANLYFEQSGLISAQIVTLTNIGLCYSQEGNFSEAIKCQKMVMKLAQKINDKESLGTAYYGLYCIYKAKGDLKEALNSYEYHAALQDTLFNEESSRKFAELNTRFENEKKEEQIKIQKLEIG